MSYNESNYKIQEFVAHSTEVNCLSIGTKSCQVLATGGEDCKVNIWKIGDSSNIWTLGSNKSPIQSLCFDYDEQCVVSGTMNGSIKVFDLNEGRLVRNLGGHQVNVTSLQYHAFGEFVVSGSLDCSMKVWDIRKKECLQTYTGHEKEVNCVRFSPDGRWVASSSKDGSLNIWDLVAGKILQSFRISPSFISSFEFNPNEFMLAGITSSRTVKLWDLETMKSISYIPPDSSMVKAIGFPTQDSSMCVATKDSMKLWNWEPNVKLINSIDISWEGINDMKVTSENKLIAGSFISNFVSLWSIDLNDLPVAAAKIPSSIDNSSKQVGSRISQAKPNIPPDVSPANKIKPTYSFRDSSAPVEDISDFALKGKGFNNRTPTAEPKKPTKHYSFRTQNEDNKMSEKETEVIESLFDEVSISNSNINNNSPQVQVVWESDNAAKDMATSMGESFWKRFQQSQNNKNKNDNMTAVDNGNIINTESETATSRGLQVDMPNDQEKVSDYISNLRNQLPPARYETNSSNNNNVNRKNRERNISYDSIDNDSKQYSNNIVDNDIMTRLDNLIQSNSSYTSILSYRITSLRILKKLYEKQDINGIIDHMKTIFDTISPEPDQISDKNKIQPSILQIIYDFFNIIDFTKSNITLDNYLEFMKIFQYLLKYNNNNSIDILIKIFLQLYNIFYDILKNSKNIISIGVDLVRDERLNKINKINEIKDIIKNKIINISYNQSSQWITKFINTVE